MKRNTGCIFLSHEFNLNLVHMCHLLHCSKGLDFSYLLVVWLRNVPNIFCILCVGVNKFMHFVLQKSKTSLECLKGTYTSCEKVDECEAFLHEQCFVPAWRIVEQNVSTHVDCVTMQ